MTFRRSHHSAFAAGFALALLFAGQAQAFTFEDKGATKNQDGSMFYNSGRSDPRNDPLSSRFDDGSGKPENQQGSGLRFGGQSQSFDQRNNPDSYFNPNVLMGR